MTMQVIEHIELASAASSILLDNIPQDGTDLMLKISFRSGDTDSILLWQLNDSESGYSSRLLTGSGSSASSNTRTTLGYSGETWGRVLSAPLQPSSSTASTFSNAEIYIPNYVSSNQKSVSVDAVGENNATAANQHLSAHLWTGTSSITSIELATYNADLQIGSSVTLYKITAGSDGTTTVS